VRARGETCIGHGTFRCYREAGTRILYPAQDKALCQARRTGAERLPRSPGTLIPAPGLVASDRRRQWHRDTDAPPPGTSETFLPVISPISRGSGERPPSGSHHGRKRGRSDSKAAGSHRHRGQARAHRPCRGCAYEMNTPQACSAARSIIRAALLCGVISRMATVPSLRFCFTKLGLPGFTKSTPW
jgi:hypothetical protein